MRAPRILATVRPSANRQKVGHKRIHSAAFVPGLVAVRLEVAFSGNPLEVSGIDYSTPGGSLVIKQHPGIYLAAGMLAVALEPGTDRQNRAVGSWIVAFCILGIIISGGESITQTHLMPLQTGEATRRELQLDSGDFRGAGLGAGTTGIENFWLLMVLNLGASGFVVFPIPMTGFPTAAPAASLPRRTLTSTRRFTGRPGLCPCNANLAGFTS